MYPLRSINFVTELIFPPLQTNLEQLQQIHHKAFADPATRYANFQVLPNGVVLSNPVNVAGAVSNTTLLPDRIRVHEQATGISQEDYCGRVHSLASLITDTLGVERFIAQQFLVQSLVNPRSSQDSLEFLRGSLLQMGDGSLSAFEHAPDLLGLRMRLPAEDVDDGTYQVRVENYERDRRSLFLETIGLFKTAVLDTDLGELGRRFESTYGTLEGPVLKFVSQFDASREA